MKEIYLAVLTALQAELPQIKWIDLYNSQLEYLLAGENKEYPISFPAVFLEFPEIQFTKLDSVRDVADTSVTFHFAQELYQDSHSTSPNQSEALAILDNVAQLVEVLELISGTNFQRFELVKIQPDTDYGNIINHRIVMNTRLYRTAKTKAKSMRTVTSFETTNYV